MLTNVTYRDLTVWKEAMDLAEEAYRATAMPPAGTFGLADQIRRAAASVPASIAQGYGRNSTGSYVQLLKVALGWSKEFETHALLAERVGLLEPAEAEALLAKSESIGKMLSDIIRTVEARMSGG